MNVLWPLDHVAHIVRNLDQAIEHYTELLVGNLSTNGSSSEIPHFRETLLDHQVELAFIDLEQSSIELIMPTEGNSSLMRFLDSRGESLHHICFRVPSVADELRRLAAQGVELIDTSPRPGARGTEVAFIHPRSCQGVLIEICSELSNV